MSLPKSSFFGLKGKLVLLICIGLLLPSGQALVKSTAVHANDPEQSNFIYIPMVTDVPYLASRMGYGLTYASGGPNTISAFGNAVNLKAGWYLNWGVNANPVRPDNIDYLQMIRVHQSLSCTNDSGNTYWQYAFREECPYIEPTNESTSYSYRPSQATIEAAARANPGSVWAVGNEIERKDWAVCQMWESPESSVCLEWLHTGQDEILPETYAIAYHDLYNIIKNADPTARIAIGGVIQVTPVRLEYLTLVWEAYQTKYGEEMPVDIWNIHTFVLKEQLGVGADLPVGTEGEGTFVRNRDHMDIGLIGDQVIAMRQWMKERGQQEKPLIISEYGALYPNALLGFPGDDPTPIINFLIDSSTYFLNTKDCSLGYAADECRLVQRWNWFSLEGRAHSGNPHTRLLDPETGELTPAGEAWIEFVEANQAALILDSW